MKDLYLGNRFFWGLGIIVLVFVLGFILPWLFTMAKILLILWLILTSYDISSVFQSKEPLIGERKLPKVFSLGDENTYEYRIKNLTSKNYHCRILDEFPMQFQLRDFSLEFDLKGNQAIKLEHALRPLLRGAHEFGRLNVFINTSWALATRRIQFQKPVSIAVLPSILQMKKYELRALNKISLQEGLKKMRRIGHSYEFEQIKNYVQGDDFRSVNWKATSRRNELMVNQYEDERSQQVYCIIDKSRSMKMPFQGLSLLDYAINTSLVISNVALKKHDKAGLLTFSDKLGTVIKADRKATQLNKIVHSLYNEKEHLLEANYELLYHASRKLLGHRSLLILFANFESEYALERVLPILRRIGRFHLLVVIFFENTEIVSHANQKTETLQGIYHQAVAQKFLYEKSKMIQKLRHFGIQAILTKPEDLSINTLNKYLELKARGLI